MALPESVSAKQLAQRLEAGESLLLLDVRELEELALAALPGVVHLPLSDSQNWLGSLPQLLGTDPNLVVMCHGGIRS